MEKFLNITGAAGAAYAGTQLVSVTGVKNVRAATASATTTVIAYKDGTKTTVTTAAQSNFSVQKDIQDAIKQALTTSWTNPVYDHELILTPVSIINA